MSFCLSVLAVARRLPTRPRQRSGTLISSRDDSRHKAGHPNLFRLGGERLGLGDPGIGAAGQSNLFADLVCGVVIELGELPVVENAEVVELLLDRTRNAGQLLEVVGGTARTGEALEPACRRRR